MKGTSTSRYPGFANRQGETPAIPAAYALRHVRFSAHYRAAPLNRRVASSLRALKVRSADAARVLLVAHPDRLPTALDALVNGTTAFFRDAAVFGAIRSTVLSALTGERRPLRILCAACSSGQEAYSVAMLLAEAGVLDSAALVGSDCRPTVQTRARDATYDASLVSAVPEDLRLRYFEQTSARQYRPVPLLRDAIVWTATDVTVSVPAGPWDLVLWRNAGMHLAPHVMARVTADFAATLRGGGFLVLGEAERPPKELGLRPVAPCIYQAPQ